MEAALSGGVSVFMIWLAAHQNEAYLVLFLGSYLETLIGPSFFIPGELFLVSGSVLAGIGVLNIWYVMAVLYGGAILGDNSSYLIGKYTGKSIFKEGRFIFSMTNYDKGKAFFDKYGSRAVFFARIMGPLSWITPFLAGIYKVPYKTFSLYNTLGVLVGVGEFIVVGYFFGNQYQNMFHIVQRYFLIIGVVIAFFAVSYWLWKKRTSQFRLRL